MSKSSIKRTTRATRSNTEVTTINTSTPIVSNSFNKDVIYPSLSIEEGYNQDGEEMNTQEKEIISDESYLSSQENLEEDIHERIKSLRISGKRKELAISDSQQEIEELKALIR